MTEIDTYQKGNFKLEEWEDVNYCEHRFYKNDKGLTNKDIVDLLNEQDAEIKRLNEELKRCREWINSDKNDYELTLSFIKSKGFSLEDVLNYEKRKNGDVE